MNRLYRPLLTLLLAASPAFAGAITYTCSTASSIANGASAVPTAACTTLQTTIADQYNTKTGSVNGVFTNATASIYVELNNTGGDVADNDQFYTTVSYQNFYLALKADESGTADVTAVNSLPACTSGTGGGSTCVNPVVAGDGVALTTPLYSVLNAKISLGGQVFGICTDFQANSGCSVQSGSDYGACTLGTTDCYNDIINVSNGSSINFSMTNVNGDYDFFTAVEHETDEALGTASCIGNTSGTPQISIGCTNGGTGVSAADLFRYSASGVRSFTSTATGSTAYFSINSGAWDIVPYNNSTNGGDYGDFSSNCTHVQDVDGCNSAITGTNALTIENDGGQEIALLDAVGYNLTSTGQSFDDGSLTSPEPSSVVMAFAGMGLIGFLHRRRRARANA